MTISIAYGAFQLERELGGYWPLAFIFGQDDKGQETQLARLDYRFGRVPGQVSFVSEKDAIADAKRYHSPRKDEKGNIFITCEGVEYNVKSLS
ncbi:hypothetical protein [Burkholderia cepacia]|uniref:hypothetical protein n=1 Tax=Burkholderia cepacia TaxID=292 RepID=UPI00398F5466